MKIIFSQKAWEDHLYWQDKNKKYVQKINKLLKEIARTPFEGSGKPEPLKFDLLGYWSRRIDREHRLVSKYENKTISIISCRYHYE
ncbi:MAG: Txe/YoeB family addiction module toxin [Melioribacteraceae bacterium]|nr:Txe/YoeB family addiction module toxin [Melioribacteraceae bacterium]MCF8412570.1 Txe/YoeB family addiction module toxin [Melioribacteraceae bacterium]MCF8431037.1 Txe/YoeB family addiction module toxin [Melioribacteraceae bacterium]